MLTAAALLVLGLILAGLAVWLARALTAFRAALMRLLRAESEIARLLQTCATNSSLLTTRSRCAPR